MDRSLHITCSHHLPDVGLTKEKHIKEIERRNGTVSCVDVVIAGGVAATTTINAYKRRSGKYIYENLELAHEMCCTRTRP